MGSRSAIMAWIFGQIFGFSDFLGLSPDCGVSMREIAVDMVQQNLCNAINILLQSGVNQQQS